MQCGEHLEAVHNGQIKRLLMNVPPGMMKSLLTGVFFPAWEWGAGGQPSMRYLTTAHKEDLAIRDNLKCRRLISSDWYQERWGVGAVWRPERKEEVREHGYWLS